MLEVRISGTGFAPGEWVLVGLGWDGDGYRKSGVAQTTTRSSAMGINRAGGKFTVTLQMPGSAGCSSRHWVQASDRWSTSNFDVRYPNYHDCAVRY
jgi:hypothetical protein